MPHMHALPAPLKEFVEILINYVKPSQLEAKLLTFRSETACVVILEKRLCTSITEELYKVYDSQMLKSMFDFRYCQAG